MMFAAVTDHVFIDGGHTIDFTNKAFEALDHLGTDAALQVLPTLVRADRRARNAPRSSPSGAIRTTSCTLAPHDDRARSRDARRRGSGTDRRRRRSRWELLADDPIAVADALVARARGAARPTKSSGARSRTRPRCASCASTCRTTTATGTPCTTRSPPRTRCTRRCGATRRRSCAAGACTRALRVYLDRFLNVPAARLPHAPRRARSTRSRSASTCRAWSTRPATRRTGSCSAGGSRAELDRGARPRAARRGRRVPLVPDGRGRRAPGHGVAGRLGGVGARPRRRRALPRRAHTDAPRAPDGRAHRVAPPPRRSALRRRRRQSGTRRQGLRTSVTVG